MFEVLCLNENLESLGYLKYINLQWNRRYYECGDFSVQILAENYDAEVRYLYRPERDEVGMLE